MDADRFDRLVLTLTHARTRRAVLGLLGAFGLIGTVTQDVAAQTCLANGTRCGGDRGTCCSGRCVRKRGTNKRFCRGVPDQGICTTELDACAGTNTPCNAAGTEACLCWVTTRGFSFCGSNVDTDCVDCDTDADCENRPTVGRPGDRCLRCPNCSRDNMRACVHECPSPATA